MRLLLAALAALVVAQPARAEPPAWIVRDADSELVLFGSVHVLPKGLDWRPAALDRALRRADDLWFELPMDPGTEGEVARLALARGMLGANESLSGLLTGTDRARLARVAAAYSVSPVMLDRMQPWMAEVALSAAAYRRAGAGGEDGVEKALSGAAPATAQRRAFETAAQQVALLADTPRAEQIASLRQTLDDMENDPDQFAQIVKAWVAGDVKALERDAIQPLRAAAPALFRRLVSERNARWAQVLDQRLKGRGRTVVVVGVGHLIGPGSVPERLRALGYKVEGP